MKRLNFYFLICFCIFALGLSVFTGLFEQQEMPAYDWLMRSRPAKAASPEIIIIEIADDTLKGLGRWPLPREFHAALIQALTESGCRMIVFDVLFSEPSRSAEVDGSLADSMRESGRVYLPTAFKLDKQLPNKRGFPESREVLGGVTEALKSSVKGVGHINIFVDADGKVRSLPLWVNQGNERLPALGLLAAADFLGYPLEKVDFNHGYVTLDNRLSIPVDSRGACLVNYSGFWAEAFTRYSYIDILKSYVAGKKGERAWFDLSVLKGKICFIGLTAAGTSDFRANPYDAVYPMIGTQASLCDSILRNDFIRRASSLTRSFIVVLIFLLACWICWAFAPVIAFLCCCGLGAGYAAIVWSLFSFKGIFLDLFLPLASIGLVYGVILLRKFFEEARKRQVLEKELEIAASIQRSFLPADIRQLGNIKIRGFLKPAKFVGGDLYDIIVLDESTFGFFIGDVSGKGVSAALIMSQAISLLRVIAQGKRDPAQVLNLFNNHLQPILKGRFITGQYIIISSKDGYFEGASAGHMPLVFFDKAKDAWQEILPASGPPLGLVANISYETVKQGFSSGDKLFMYTDGWTESRNSKGIEFGLSRLKDILYGSRTENPDSLLAILEYRQKEFEKNASQHDDLTALILEVFL